MALNQLLFFLNSPQLSTIKLLYLAHVATRKCSAMAAYAKLSFTKKGNNSLRVCDYDCPRLALNKRHNNRVLQKSSPPSRNLLSNLNIRFLTLFNTHAWMYGNFSVHVTLVKPTFSRKMWNKNKEEKKNFKNKLFLIFQT